MSKARFIGEYPKVGIRPVIDGRQGGVRESLEEQTMNMARSVAELISSELKYSNGDAVECVIADGTIGRVPEAAACAEKFRREGVGVVISVTPCWCYGSETIDYDGRMPQAIWGFNGTERPGAVYLAAALAGHSQKGMPAFGIYGHDVQDAGDRADFFQTYLGMRNEQVDMSEIVRRIDEGIYDKEEYQKALAWTLKHCRSNEGEDFNIPAKKKDRAGLDADWEYVVKMFMIFRDLMCGNPKLLEMGFKEESLGHNAIVGGFQGQRQWTDHFPNGDFAEAFMNTSFDWNGIREPFAFATENDSLNGVAMLFGKLLTNTAQIFADVRTYWSPAAVERVTGKKLEGMAANGIIHLINSGAASLDGSGRETRDGKPVMKPFWEITEKDVEECLKATTWYPANRDYFRGGGFSSNFLSKGGMPVTMMRMNIVKGLGPVFQLAEGYTVDIDPEIHRILNERTDRTWPTTWFAPRLTGEGAFKDVYSVMNNWGANHGAISYGHIGADLITLASMLRIPVCMHNVDRDKIFRPSAWNAFGMEPEGSDFRACQNYGALYK